MTLEDLFTREYESQKGRIVQLEQTITAKDMTIARLTEELEAYKADCEFLTNKFKIRKSSDGSAWIIDIKTTIWNDDPDYDRLRELCGFEEEENVSGSD